MTTTLDATDLTLRYGEITAVDGMSFTLHGPGIFGLLGRNGSGKTSLLSVLAGFRPADAGEILLDGQPVFENPAAIQHLCLIRESLDTVEHNWPAHRVSDAVDFAAATRARWDDAYAKALLERFELPKHRPVTELSRGQRSALGVVLGLASRAPVTMFDESYLGMDASARYVFYDEVLASYMAHPRTIVLSTHLIAEVSDLFDQVLVIDRGRLLLHEDADQLRARGRTVIGPTEAVDRFTRGLRVLGERRLGPTKATTVYGPVTDAQRAAARDAGLDLEPIALQDLFVHLTDPTDDRSASPAGGAR